MRLPVPVKTSLIQHEMKNLFYQESCFLPLKFSNSFDYMLACFDTKNYVHLVNVKSFKYSYIHKDNNENEQQSQISSDSNSDSINNSKIKNNN